MINLKIDVKIHSNNYKIFTLNYITNKLILVYTQNEE